jgi:hypothetical protein
MKWVLGIPAISMMQSRLLGVVRFVGVATMAVGLTGCWARTESYRYKLTLAVNTSAGVERASSVVEVVFRGIVIPDRGVIHQLRGEALYLDLGAGRRPLIALITKQLHPRPEKDAAWSPDGGPGISLIARIYGKALSENLLEQAAAISRMRGAREVAPSDLPDLVTFADTNNPASVIEVDPDDLQATLGPDVSWNKITLEITDEPIATGLKAKLPWLTEYLKDNRRLNRSILRTSNELSNILSSEDFSQTGEAGRGN